MIKPLVEAYLKTQEVDESGDATLINFLEELKSGSCPGIERPTEWHEWDDVDLFTQFLIWANGPKWNEWIWTAKPGDVPPK